MSQEHQADPLRGLHPGGYRETLRVAFPLIISMGSFTLMQFCDRMFLARFSAVSIQAALPAGILAFTLTCGFMELAGYANTFVAQYHGAGDPRGCSRSMAQAVLLALLGWPILILLIPVGLWILGVSGHAPDVLEQERVYFAILMAGGVTIPLGVGASTFFTGRGDTRTTMMANVIGNAANILLDYGLIYGHWGLPRLGIVGAGLATVLAGFIAPAILLILFFSPGPNRRYGTRSNFRYDKTLMRRIIRYGLPSSIHMVLDITSFTVFVLFTGRMGERALAASNIAFSINMLAFLPLIGLGIAAATLVGQYQGRREPEHAERAGWSAVKIGVIYTVAVGLTYVLFPAFYLSFFSSRAEGTFSLEEILPLGRVMLFLMAVWGVMDSGNVILGGALKGAGDTRFVMYYSVSMAWGVFVLGQVIIVFALKGSVLQAWGWLTFYIMLLALGYLWRFQSGRWKAIDLLGPSAPPPPTRPGVEAVVVME